MEETGHGKKHWEVKLGRWGFDATIYAFLPLFLDSGDSKI